MRKIATVVVWLAVAAAMFFAGRGCGRMEGDRNGAGDGFSHPETRVDTVVVRDTLRDTVLVPVQRLIVRVDTVLLSVPGDTVRVEVALPVERKTYLTQDYRAVVEGFRPSLAELELYPATAFITRETTIAARRKRWGIGVQAGWGFSAKGAVPYVGVGIQYSVLEW